MHGCIAGGDRSAQIDEEKVSFSEIYKKYSYEENYNLYNFNYKEDLKGLVKVRQRIYLMKEI